MKLFDWLFNKKKQQVFGWKADGHDLQDYNFSNEFWSGLHNDGYINLREYMPPVVDQGLLGSCVPCSIAALLSCLVKKELEEDRGNLDCNRGVLIPLSDNESKSDEWIGKYLIKPDGELCYIPGCTEMSISATEDSFTYEFSRLFLYYEGRKLENKSDDAGMNIRSGLKILSKKGICLEKDWPYKTTRYSWKPSKKAYKEAKKHRIQKYWRLKGLNDIKINLDDGYPVIMGITLYNNSWKQAGDTGIMPVPEKDDRPLLGHCILVVGYDDAKDQLLCRNSMGTQWGNSGYFYMPQTIMFQRNMVSDLWTIRGQKIK